MRPGVRSDMEEMWTLEGFLPIPSAAVLGLSDKGKRRGHTDSGDPVPLEATRQLIQPCGSQRTQREREGSEFQTSVDCLCVLLAGRRRLTLLGICPIGFHGEKSSKSVGKANWVNES